MAVDLHPLDDPWLTSLTAVAVTDADPTEVMPPVDGPPGWHPDSEAAFGDFHRARRAERVRNTYVIAVDGHAAGSLRLDWIAPGVLETGLWIARSARGKGVGAEAIRLALTEATTLGATRVVAETTVDNHGSRGALRRNGAAFTIDGDAVTAVFDLPKPLSSRACP
ncbi:GNAT family N-acetyltransferase [Actinorhabdospora filicis]|nr:GNAT family N-acetyltransferase [Actinorhabdospora filicis]